MDRQILVDEFQNCVGTKGIYALGDVCGKVELTPTAIAAGRRLADRCGHTDTMSLYFFPTQ